MLRSGQSHGTAKIWVTPPIVHQGTFQVHQGLKREKYDRTCTRIKWKNPFIHQTGEHVPNYDSTPRSNTKDTYITLLIYVHMIYDMYI